MEMLEKVTLIGAKKLDFESNGQRVQGVKVHYLSDESNANDEVGRIPSSVFLPIDRWAEFASKKYPLNVMAVIKVEMTGSKLRARIVGFKNE